MKETKFLVFWNPFEERNGYSGAELFSEYFRKHTGVIYADLKNNKDPHSMKLLKEADLIVVFLKQDRKYLDTYFNFCHMDQDKILYLVYDYFEKYVPDRVQIMHRYRIPEERLGVLPFNSRLIYAADKGCLQGYLKGGEKAYPYEIFTGFFRCLHGAEKKLHQALWKSSGILR